MKKSSAATWLRTLIACASLSAGACSTERHVPQKANQGCEEPKFRRYKTGEIMPKYRIKEEKKDDESLGSILYALENVPDAIQYVVNRKGGTIWIFGPGGQIDHNMKKGKNDGVYYPHYKRALIPQCNDESTINTALHEYGHMVAHLMGDIDEKKEFKKLYRFSLEKREESFSKNWWENNRKYGKKSPSEFFATSFAEYYTSAKTRASLKRDFPEVHDYFAMLEQKVMIAYELRKTRLKKHKSTTP